MIRDKLWRVKREKVKQTHVSGVNYFPVRVASIKDVTELLIVVHEWRQNVTDVLRGQLVRLDAVRQRNYPDIAVHPEPSSDDFAHFAASRVAVEQEDDAGESF
jgi:hypothetical protein